MHFCNFTTNNIGPGSYLDHMSTFSCRFHQGTTKVFRRTVFQLNLSSHMCVREREKKRSSHIQNNSCLMLHGLITQSLLFWRIAGNWCLGFARFNLSIAISKQIAMWMCLLGWALTRTLILFLLIVCLWTLCMIFQENHNGMYLNRLCLEPDVVSQFLFHEPSFNQQQNK